ncbi:E3 ubiquitin-protein ligase rnf213-alpha-like isoform X4 [Dermochelys coriacea]|uniref:E3 ubiquitin-protein ligase rnf213-alpha-like isoform X4 n=1 Tax=Dermochelys coriacea TaxID=27794 RepID=UPI001CA91DC5|nr:E3 ubiquitin-protein ligase rnf213-alpha-like isoform X4 [Dermochelys coriacea]
MKCAECNSKCLEGGTLCLKCQQALKGTNGSQCQTEVPGAKSLELDTNEPNPLSSGLSEDAPAAQQVPGPGLQPPTDSAEAAIEERKVGATDRATGEAETEEQKEGKTPDSRGSGSLEPEINEGNEENEGKPESPGLLKDDLFGQESGPGSQLQAKTEEHKDTSSDSNLAESARDDDLLLQDYDFCAVVPDSADGEDGEAPVAEINIQRAEQTAAFSCQEWRTSELNQDEAHPLSSGRELGPGSQLQCHAAGVTDERLLLSPRQETRIQQFSGHHQESPVKVERHNLTGSESQPKEVKKTLGRKRLNQPHVASKSQKQVPGSAVREEPVELEVKPHRAEWRTSEPNQDKAHPLSSGQELGPGSQLQCHAAGVTDETQSPGSTMREEPMELEEKPHKADRKGNEENSASEASILSENPYFSSTSSSVEDMMTLEFVAILSEHFKVNGSFSKIIVAAYSHPRRYQEFARMEISFKNNYGFLIVGQAKIPVSDLQSRQPIYYKYGIIDIYNDPRTVHLEHISKTVQKNEKAEFHRVLIVPDSAIKAGGVWTQFDDICQFSEKSWSGFLSRGKSKEKASESILQFLEDKLYQELFHRKDFGDVERKLVCYKECLKTSNIGDAERKINDHETDFDGRKVYDDIRKFIENVLGNPKFQNPAISAMDVLLFALCTIFHHSIHISAEAMSKIEQMAQNIDLQEGKFKNLKEPRKRECILALKHVCIQSSKNSKSMCWVWLLPLLYEIQRESFEKAEDPLTSQDMQFLPFAQLRQDEEKQTKVLAMIKDHQIFIGSYAPLAEKVILMLALKNFCREPVPHIHVPLQLLLNNVDQRITNRLAEGREINESDVSVVLEDIARRTKAWLGTRRQTGNAEDALQPKELEDVLQCLNLTFTLVTKFLKHPKKIPFNSVMMSLQIFELFSGTEDLLQTKRDFQDLNQTQGLKEFLNVAESWIKELFLKLSDQKKVFFDYIDKWQQLISAGLFCDEWTCDWQKLIKSLFADWIERVNHKCLFDHYLVFIKISKFQDTELENCFSQHIIQSIKGLTKSKKSMLKEILHKFSKTKKPILVQIISIIIENMWTEELNQIANANQFEKNTASVLIQLLNSSMGLDIISAVQKLKPKVQNQINEDAQLLLSKVSELFSFVGRSVFSGDIPFDMLPAILQHTQEFAEMLTLIEPSYSRYIKEVLDVRRNEFEQLKKQTEQRRAFLYLCSCITNIIKVDIGAMEQSVAFKQSIKDQMLVKKYSISGQEKSEGLQSHPLAKHNNMVRKVHTLQESEFFRKLWKLKAELAKNEFPDKALLSLDEVQENIYIPAMIEFQNTYLALKDFSISLGDIERQFGKLLIDEQVLRKEFKIMEKSEGGSGSKSEWAEAAVVKINYYLKLSTVVKTAKMIDELRRILGLGGDFQLLDDLTKYEDEDFKDKTLDYMTDDIVKVKDTLSNIPESVLDFLKELLECAKKDFISWITTVIKDKTELPTFVELASISAGENDMDIDKVRFFRDAVSASVPILFDLTPKSGFEAFSSALNPIRDAVENDNKLPKKLKDSCHNREWLQMVHDCHGSVERSSMSQARAINGNGIFIISTPQKFKPSLDNCISLLLPGDIAEKAAKGHQTDKTDSRTYSLAQLTELQNKLMLIATKAEQGREEVNRFLEILEKIEMVGKLYLQLLSIGNILFIDWKAEIYCDPKRKVTIYAEFGIAGILVQSNKPILEELDGICKIMEHCLEEWKKYLETQRNNYCHINMFTARQLFYLCSKLAQLHEGQTDPQVLNMLSVFKHDVKVEDIGEALKRALETPAESVDISEKDDQSVSWNDYIVKFPQLIQGLVESGYDDSVGKAALQSYLPNSAITEQMLMEFALDYADEEEKIEELSKLYDEQREAFLQTSMKFKNRNRDVDPSAFQSLVKDELATSFESLPSIHDKVHFLWNAYCSKLTGLVSDRYISLDVFGEMLKYLTSPETAVIERTLPVGLEAGKPCLVTCKEEQMLLFLLSVYTHSEGAPLPTYDEVLVCTPETEEEDIELIVRRAFSPDPRHKKIYCLLGAEKLVYKVSKKLESLFFHFAQSCSNADYRFLIFCDAKTHNSYVMTAFDTYKVSFSCDSGVDIQKYLKTHLRVPSGVAPVAQVFEEPFQQNVKIVFSERAGMGKSLFVANTTRKAKPRPENAGLSHKTIRLTESEIDFGFFLEELRSLEQKPTEAEPRIFHIDVSPVVSKGLYKLLIELCILRHIQSPDGMVWKCRKSHLYLIEYLVRGKGISSTRKQEMTSEMEKVFLGLFPAVKCISPIEVLEMLTNNSSGAAAEVEQQLLDSDTFRGDAFQRSYQYISRYQRKANLDSFCFTPGRVEGTQEECLRLLLESCGRKNPSWTELSNFTRFLNLQLMKCENSVFCSSELVEEGFQGFKAFVIKFMITMSKDFALPSLAMADESSPSEEDKMDEDSVLRGYQLRRKWEQESHPYIIFHADHHSMEFLGFHINRSFDAVDAHSQIVLEKKVIDRHLYLTLEAQKVPFNKKFEDLSRQEQLETLCSVFGVRSSEDPDESYQLTLDNTMKMLAIHLRFQCGIPVIIMGETGCGKTKLVQFMCSLQRAGRDVQNMMLVRVHGGTSSKIIHQKVKEAIELAHYNEEAHNMDTVLFFDEANTTEAVFAIKEVLCDQSVNGEPISTTRLKVVAACNPYKRHTKETIEKLENAGLGYRVRSEDTLEKLGYIPLRQLVYRVQPLPPSMLPLVWDFGELNEKTQSLYIRQIVKSIVKEKLPKENMDVFTSVISTSQKFLREKREECRIASLRDIERCMGVLLWFYNLRDLLFPLIDEKKSEAQNSKDYDPSIHALPKGCEKDQISVLNEAQRSLVLAVGVCYYVSLESRQDYLKEIAKCFSVPESLLQQEIVLCQEVFLDNLSVPKTTARNDALRENIFMMVICMDLRVPLFLVGKPGSSKSLSKTIAADAMQGRLSKTELFKRCKQVQLVSFQCSPHSKPEGIISTFKQCAQFQRGQKLEEFASVVILDEIGLAEDSPEMPLKTLHPLLEDGCVDDEAPEPYKKVGFVGISNWALDPAKMNRGLLVFRTDLNKDELVKTAKGICTDEMHVTKIEHLFPPLADFYCEVLKEQSMEFFGLRDFYSLIKMILSYAKNIKSIPQEEKLISKAILRNFGGLKDLNSLELFGKYSPISLPSNLETSHTVHLLQENLDKKQMGFVSRYLLLLTTNHAAFQIIQMTKLMDIENCDIIFGSGFPRDQEYSQVCRSVNRVKICMETGRPVILLNIHNLYESLYDALNQCFVRLGGNYYVDLGLGTHRVKCRVKEEFRLIVIEEKNVVYTQFPTPLLNRLEKHCLEMNTILHWQQKDLRMKLEEWAKLFVTIKNTDFCCTRSADRAPQERDVFIGFSDDTSATVVLQYSPSDLQGICLLSEESVLAASKSKLIECATPDAILRLKYSLLEDAEQIQDLYFGKQKHNGLIDILRGAVNQESNADGTNGLCLEVSTHARLLNQRDLEVVRKRLTLQNKIRCLFLSQFDTEHAFRQELSKFFRESTEEKLLFVQFNFDEPQSSKRLLACAKYCIVDERRKPGTTSPSHVVIITKVPRILGGCSYLAFSAGEWHSVHLDDLLPPETFAANLGQLSKMTVAEIFMISTQQGTDTSCPVDSIAPEDAEKTNYSPEENLQLINTEFMIKQSVQKAVIQLEDKKDNSQRATKRIQILYDALFQSQSKNILACHFMKVLKKRICNLLQEREEVSHKPKEWIFRKALSSEFVLEGTSFRHVVWIHLEDIVANMFAQILAVIDANNNLDHISQETPFSDLWLQMFKDESFLKIKYTSKAPDAKISVLSMSEDPSRSTQCCFPFSWVLKARLDEIWETVHRVKGYPKDPTVDSAEMFQSSVLNMPVPDGNNPEMVQHYASDFVRMAFPGQDVQVYEILSNVLITGAKRLCTSLAHDDVEFSLIWLHIEYFYLQENYQLFINLVKNEETLANELQKVYKEDATKMFVALDAVSIILKQLQPTEKELLPFNACLSWLKRIKSIKHTVELITSDDYQMRLYCNKEELLNRVLHQWNCTNIVYLLIDHLLHDETNVDEKLLKLVVKQFVFLWNLLYKIEDHKPAKIFEVVTKVLKRCSNNAATVYLVKGVNECKSCQNEITDPAELPCGHIFCTQCIQEWNIRQCKICKKSVPEDYMPTASQITREAVANHNKFRRKCNSFFVEFVSSYCFGDKIPPSAEIIEQLIKFVACKPSNPEHQEIRKVYKPTSDLSPFEECMDPSPTVKSSLLKMLLRCRLDNVKEHLEGYLSRMEEVLSLNQSSCNDFYFMVVCCFEDFMYSSFQEDASQNSEHLLSTADLSAPSSATVTSIENLQFIAQLRLAIGNVAAVLGRELPSDQNTWTSAENAEKQSQLVNSMKNLVEKAQTPWPQIFLIRNLCNFYGMNIMQKILQREQWILPRGIETSQDIKISSNTPLMLVTLDRARGHIKKSESEEAKQITAITKQMERLLQAPLASEESMENKLEKIMSDVSSHENAALLEVVLHTALTLTLSQNPLTELFKSICFQPSVVKGTYLPTMPGDLLFDVMNWKNVHFTKMWRCRCGQHWPIQACGLPMEIMKCVCGSEVGGTDHKPVEGFEEVDITKDKTERGYVLGSPSSRNNETERDLPAASVSIARALLHSSMLLGTFTDTQSILELMKVKPQDAEKFFCDHLEKDIQFLAESLSGNIDDATMTVHLFLRYILDSTADTNMTITFMHEKADRVQWESCLKAVTQSFFQVLEQKLASAKQQIVEKGAHSSNVLLKVAYGQSPPFSHLPSCGLINMPCMWKFEQRMTVQRLTHLVQQENGADQFPVLLELLSKLQHIRHVQHLPEILTLQRSLIHFFQNGNIHEGERLSVRKFLERDDLSDDQRLTFERAMQTVRKVWSNIRSSPRSSEISIPEELWCTEINSDTAILDLLPTTPSITSIVTKFLIQLQNSCIDTAAQFTKEKQRSVSAEEVKHASVLSVTESDLITMALLNFQYVLEEDGTKTTHYNFLTLQGQVIHRFISGKPVVKAQTTPSITLNNVKTLHSTKDNVKEQLCQEPLSVSLMKRIMEEASSVNDISRALSTLKVAAEFLAVTGGDPERLLTEYVRNELKMEANAKQFRDLPVVPQTRLKHILSLWQILSAKRSVLLVQMNQNPFFLIDKGFHDELADREREELTTALSTVNIEFFIIELHEMITVTLESYENSWGIVETFQEYLKKEEKEDNYIMNLTNTVSPDLQLKNIISVWKSAVLINKTYAHSYSQE